MDQGASVFSTPSSALYISFYPKLHATPVPLPQTAPPVAYVVANTLKTANKLETSKIHYNLRVVETLVAARVLARGLGVHVDSDEKIRLREVLARWRKEGLSGDEDAQIKALKEGLEKIIPEVERILGTEQGKRGLTYDEMVEATGLSKAEFDKVYLSWVEGERVCDLSIPTSLNVRSAVSGSNAFPTVQESQARLHRSSSGSPVQRDQSTGGARQHSSDPASYDPASFGQAGAAARPKFTRKPISPSGIGAADERIAQEL